MKVIVVEPEREPYVKDIESGLESLQSEVGGYIQVVYPFEEAVGLICNEEGKINGLSLNRALYDDNGEIYDIVAGTFLIAGLSEDDFSDLSEELIQQFIERFKQPEGFIKMAGKIICIPLDMK